MGGKSQEPEPLRLPLLSDHAISNSDLEADHFGLEKKLGAVVDAIRLKDTATPFSIMLTGGWGAGKTSAMSWLDATFKNEKEVKSSADYCNVDTCWFYPWKYQNKEDVWRGLIAEVILRAMRVEGVDSAKILKAARQFGGFLGRGFIRLLGSANVKVGNAKATGVEADIDLKEAISGVMEEYGKHVTPQEAYFNEFENIFKGWVEDTYPSNGNRRLVVFIDDLDRCMPDIALQVLEALKLYLQVPNLVFVVGVERSVIDRIVHKRYSDLVGADVMAHGFHEKAARYLDKMFTVEVNIEPTDEEVSVFFTQRVELTPVWQAVPETHRDTLKRVILNLSGRTPRSIVRLVNRVVIACGRWSDNGTLTLAQELQRELLDAVCQALGYEDLPQRHASGRQFFALWSRILGESPDRKEIRLSKSELISRTAYSGLQGNDDDQQWTIHSEKNAGRSALGPEGKLGNNTSAFDHFSPLTVTHFSSYHSLLTSLEVALLLKIPYLEADLERDYPPPSTLSLNLDENWEWLHHTVASSKGIDPYEVTEEYLRTLNSLDLNGSEIPDIAPLAMLTGLKALYLSDADIDSLTPISGLPNLEILDLAGATIRDINSIASLANLAKLEKLSLSLTDLTDALALKDLKKLTHLGLTHTPLKDIFPLANLIMLTELHLSSSLVSDISPLGNLNNLRRLYLAGTHVEDVSILKNLPNLSWVVLPDVTVWNPQTEPIPDRYNPEAR